MQCPNKNTIMTVDKKAIKKDYEFFRNSNDETARRLFKKILITGNQCWELGVEIYFKEKKYTFFNREPSGSAKNTWNQYWLWQNGYYKTDVVGCGKCEICKTEKSKEWSVKATCEYKTWKEASFLTFTYNEKEHEINKGYINKANMVKFWKDLRYHLYKNAKNPEIDLSKEYENMKELPKEIELMYMFTKRKPNKKPLRYIQCHEYGSKKGREHHHAVIFNFRPTDLVRYSRDRRGYYLYKSKKMNKLWGHGWVIIADVNANVAAYVARYNTKKFSNTSGKVNETIAKLNEAIKHTKKDSKERQMLEEIKKVWTQRRESISASSLGYISRYYWEINKEKIVKQKGIYVKWNKGVKLEKIPKAMEKQFEEEYPEEYEMYEYEKEKNGKEQWELILSKTSLSESEYIKETYRQRMKSLRLLKREYDEKPVVQTIYENA